MASRRWLYFGGFVITGVLLVGAGLMGIVDGLSALSGDVPAASEELVLLTMLGAAAEWVVTVLVLGMVAALFLTATVVSILRSASLPRDDRLVSIVDRLERHCPILRRFDVTEKVKPTTEDRRQQLEEQYVTGEMSEAEFERKLAKLMDESPDGISRSEGAPLSETDDRER